MTERPPVFAVTGYKDSGKTTFTSRIIKELSEKDYTVASVKHTSGEYSIDDQGTDTWKHAESGSETVVFSTASETAFIFKEAMDIHEIVEMIKRHTDPDIVIVEGFKSEDLPGIEASEGMEIEPVIHDLIQKIEIYRIYKRLPGIDCGRCGHRDCYTMAEAKYSGEDVVCLVAKDGVSLQIDGKDIHLSNFPAQMLEGGIRGMISSLKGVKEGDKIVIKIFKEGR